MTWTNTTLRERENASIEEFVLVHADKLWGRTLDFGCGLQPYRKIVENVGGDYRPFDRWGFPGSTVTTDLGDDSPLQQPNAWDAILCTQVIQYVERPAELILDFWAALKPGGWLIMTGPTNWPEVETDDLWRFTITGIDYLINTAGFDEITVVSREALMINDIGLSIGWGAVGRAKS